jgi:hypothetical protein
MKYLLYLGSLCFLLNTSCTQTDKKDKENTSKPKEMTTDLKTTIKNYKNFPNYSVQLDKGSCKVELIGNDIPLYTAFDEGGFSSLIPFNANIISSGEQKLKIKIYPAAGKQTLDDYSRVKITVYLFPNDKSSTSEKTVIKDFEIPKEVIDKKLPFFEYELTFKAEVPFDFSEELANAQQLDKVDGIENKVLAAYNKLRGWLEKGDTASVAAFRRPGDEKLAKVFYYDTDQSLAELFDYTFLYEDSKKLDVMPKYNLVFYAKGKLVRLERADNKDEVITLTGKTSDGDETTSDLAVLLYLPKNSDEFVQY